MELLFFIGLCYAITQAWGASTTAVGRQRTAARTRATARGGHYDRNSNARRAARQATTGWWMNEIRHGFPVTREGFRAGMNDHHHVLSTTRATAHRDEAKRSAERRKLWDEARQHWQAVTAQGHQRRSENPDGPPLADGKTPGRRAVPLTWEEYGPLGGWVTPTQTGQGNGSTNGGTPVSESNGAPGNGGGGGSDASYEEVVKSSEQVAQAADSLDVSALEQIGPLIDQLGGLIPTDGTTLGIGADLARACAEVKENLNRVKDLAAGLHDRVTNTYGPTHEAVAASGEQAAEPAFHTT